MSGDGLGTLEPFRRRAFELAWTSWGEGNFGIGAVLVDPDLGEGAGAIVSEGRNRVALPPGDGQPLGGTYLAHAEMNAFASLDRYNARGLHLVSTLEPCLMCAATAIFLNVAAVDFAAADEYFSGMHDELWPAHPYTRDRRPATRGPMRGPVAAFARLLPLQHTLATIPGSNPATFARRHNPALAALADSPEVADLRARAGAMSVDDGWQELSGRLDGLG